MRLAHSSINQDFRCLHCRSFVTTERMVSAVNNRNHCPYCLWTRHLDLYQPGDRLSACKAAMQPIGLTLKETYKKYNNRNSGELMLVHQCQDCGKVSINRIAADDFLPSILEIYENSFQMGLNQREEINRNEIVLLSKMDSQLIRTRLFGKGSEYDSELRRNMSYSSS
jgi:hypothetical protein